jgi:hypothetical protein
MAVSARARTAACLCAATLAAIVVALPADERPRETPSQPAAAKPMKDADGLVPFNQEKTVLLDHQGKRVLLKTKVALRDGLLEMLCCKKQTKEHEAILSLDAQAYAVHAALVAAGAEPGKPVSFSPEYQAPTGRKLDVHLTWTDDKGKLQRVPAQNWVRHAIHRYYGEPLEQLPEGLAIPRESNLRYDEKHKELSWYGPMSKEQRDEMLALSKDPAYRKAIEAFHRRSQSRRMEADWVFAGSGFFVDQTTGKQLYKAEAGDLICVANFPSATVDVDVESSASGQENLMFEAWTERIPPIGTPVTIELAPAPLDKAEEK